MAAIQTLSTAAAPLGRWLNSLHFCAHDAAVVFCTTGDMAAAVTTGFGGPLLRAFRA